ncbi:hypothetical protein [Nocardia sp. NPDC056100]|uniref:hypothetical protein n=1 Tax=Nocardia sp. NPDC056100 TaxID=3345712 RepID=UPI0035DF8B42
MTRTTFEPLYSKQAVELDGNPAGARIEPETKLHLHRRDVADISGGCDAAIRVEQRQSIHNHPRHDRPIRKGSVKTAPELAIYEQHPSGSEESTPKTL